MVQMSGDFAHTNTHKCVEIAALGVRKHAHTISLNKNRTKNTLAIIEIHHFSFTRLAKQ